MSDYAAKVKDLVSGVEAVLGDMQKDISEKQTELDKLIEEIGVHTESSSNAKELWEKTKARCAGDIAAITLDIETLKEKKHHLEADIDNLVTKKGNLKAENIKLAEENAKFKTYEEKAWKSLHAKENSLLEREEAVEHKEGLNPRHKTLLPPI